MIRKWFKKTPINNARAEAELFDTTPVVHLQQDKTTSYVNRCSIDEAECAEAIINAARSVY